MQDGGADSWPQLIEYSLSKCQLTESISREVGLTMLKSIAADLVISTPTDSNTLHSFPISASPIAEICQNCLLDCSNEGKISILALSVAGSVLASLPSEGQAAEIFNPLLMTAFRAFNNLYHLLLQGSLPESKLIAFLQILVEIAEEKPLLFCAQLGNIFPPIVSLIGQEEDRDSRGLQTPKSVKQLLVELLLELAESSPKVVRKFKGPQGEVQ